MILDILIVKMDSDLKRNLYENIVNKVQKLNSPIKFGILII